MAKIIATGAAGVTSVMIGSLIHLYSKLYANVYTEAQHKQLLEEISELEKEIDRRTDKESVDKLLDEATESYIEKKTNQATNQSTMSLAHFHSVLGFHTLGDVDIRSTGSGIKLRVSTIPSKIADILTKHDKGGVSASVLNDISKSNSKRTYNLSTHDGWADQYVTAAAVANNNKGPAFRTVNDQLVFDTDYLSSAEANAAIAKQLFAWRGNDRGLSVYYTQAQDGRINLGTKHPGIPLVYASNRSSTTNPVVLHGFKLVTISPNQHDFGRLVDEERGKLLQSEGYQELMKLVGTANEELYHGPVTFEAVQLEVLREAVDRAESLYNFIWGWMYVRDAIQGFRMKAGLEREGRSDIKEYLKRSVIDVPIGDRNLTDLLNKHYFLSSLNSGALCASNYILNKSLQPVGSNYVRSVSTRVRSKSEMILDKNTMDLLKRETANLNQNTFFFGRDTSTLKSLPEDRRQMLRKIAVASLTQHAFSVVREFNEAIVGGLPAGDSTVNITLINAPDQALEITCSPRYKSINPVPVSKGTWKGLDLGRRTNTKYSLDINLLIPVGLADILSEAIVKLNPSPTTVNAMTDQEFQLMISGYRLYYSKTLALYGLTENVPPLGESKKVPYLNLGLVSYEMETS